MAVFHNSKKDSPITGVEFSPVSDGNFSFYHIDSPISKEGVRQWLTSAAVGQEIIAETQVSGHPVFVTHGDRKKSEILDLLAARGEQMTPYSRKKSFSEQAWQTGAVMAFTGQMMQLTSSFLRPDRKADWSLRMLAVPNLLANIWVFFYGAERSEDKNRLTYLKRHFNEELGTHASGGVAALPDIQENRSVLRGDPPEKKGLKDHMDGFLKRNSVTVGEIGMRYFGATALAFPINKWGKGFNRLLEGEFKEAYKLSRTATPIKGTNKLSHLTHYAGLLSLTGKTVAITSKAPDPYSATPPTWLDKMRERFTFNAGGALETVAFGIVAWEGFSKKKISFRKGGREHIDFLSGIGGSLFTIRYFIRNWAPFGVRDMNMNELYAHVTDSLAQMPPDQLPQLLADTAADLTNHFKDKHLKYGEVFAQLLSDLYRYHHIALDNLGTQPEERVAKANSMHTESKEPVTLSHRAKPHASHVEMAQASQTELSR
ncbi:MAG: hypothetical protein GC188_08975 [Alphaproteobacteria bacterium]|nr:hypothetical protein [Alphaproteobacteria bacterium]